MPIVTSYLFDVHCTEKINFLYAMVIAINIHILYSCKASAYPSTCDINYITANLDQQKQPTLS